MAQTQSWLHKNIKPFKFFSSVYKMYECALCEAAASIILEFSGNKVNGQWNYLLTCARREGIKNI